jgi:histone H2A
MDNVNLLLRKNKTETLSLSETRTAVRMTLDGDLLKNALSYADKVVEKYRNEVKHKEKGTKPKARSKLAGIIFPVSRIENIMRQLSIKKRISSSSPVFLASVLQYIMRELLDLATNTALGDKKKRLSSRHVALATGQKEELSLLFKNVCLGGGVIPHIEPKILNKK